jgi:hypothetical protein
MRAGSATGSRPGNCADSYAACPSAIPAIPTTAGCATHATQMIISWASIGPKAEAEAIKEQLARFLRDELALEPNAEKTLITHARTRAARYLGYEIIVQHSDSKITKVSDRSTGRSRCACHSM